jgi:AmmeMemoRadiSam system protein B
MTYSKEMGAEKAELLKHGTSGDITGDTHNVVGYAALTIKKR